MADKTRLPSRFLAFWLFKCPRCRKGDVFTGSIFNLRTFTNTHRHCPNCKLDYEPETGFFWGAMYWSYAIIVGMLVTTSVLLFLLGAAPNTYFIVLPIVIVTLSVPIFRYSRLLMLYWVYPFMYRDKYKEGFPKENK